MLGANGPTGGLMPVQGSPCIRGCAREAYLTLDGSYTLEFSALFSEM